MDLLPDDRLISSSDDKTIKVWDLSTGKCLSTLVGQTQEITSLIVLPNNRVAAASCAYIKVWDLVTATCVHTLKGHTDIIRDLVLLSNNVLASCSNENTVKFWGLDDNSCIRTLAGHTNFVYCLILLRNGHLASGSFDKTINIWNVTTGECVQTLVGHKDCVLSLDSTLMTEPSRYGHYPVAFASRRLAPWANQQIAFVFTTMNHLCVKSHDHLVPGVKMR